MKNITIRLDENTAAWVSIYAAQHGKSISRLIGELLHGRMQEVRDYNQSMRHYLSAKAFRFGFVAGCAPKKAELNDRHSLRRHDRISSCSPQQ